MFFNEVNADSLNILVVYWYHPPDYWDYVEHAHWINMQIVERFNAEGIDFAFPTQTLHLAGDEKRPVTVGKMTQCRVATRRRPASRNEMRLPDADKLGWTYTGSRHSSGGKLLQLTDSSLSRFQCCPTVDFSFTGQL